MPFSRLRPCRLLAADLVLATRLLAAVGFTSPDPLARAGRRKRGAPIGHLVPGLVPKIARVTPHQLLAPRAGLGDDAPPTGPHDGSALGAACRALADRPVFAAPAKIYSYSNPGFWLAGLAAAVAGGQPSADLAAERGLATCGLVRATVRPTLAQTWPLAVGQLFSSAPGFTRSATPIDRFGLPVDPTSGLPGATRTGIAEIPHRLARSLGLFSAAKQGPPPPAVPAA